MNQPSQTDVVAVLLDQHAQIRRLFTEVSQRRGQPGREAFQQLVRLLAVHETAEQEVLHPQVRLLVGGDQAIVDARLEEERHAKELLAQLDGLSPEGDDFEGRLKVLRKAVQDHAEHEEREEFPRLRSSLNPVQLEAMGVAVRVAEVMAPTHPHPEVNSLAANLMAGPMLALVDRTRDLVRDAVQRSRPVGLDAAEEAPRQHTRTRPEWRQVGMGDLHKGAQRGRDRKPDRRALEERSVKELRERARELQLPGRSSMRKDELIAALRKQPK
jgi:hemerythrin superfamily protein